MKKNRPYGYDSAQDGTLFAAKEAYRTIRTNLMFSLAKQDCRTIMFTSSVQGEGKTTSAVNVAFSIARNNKKVLLLDLDLRRPRIHRILKSSSAPGLTNYLSGFSALEEVLHKDVYPGLDVIFGGTISPNPAEITASEGMVNLIRDMKKNYDYIILDTPPVNVVSDALSLLPLTDGVVLVVRPKLADRKEVQRAVDQITFVGGKILGAVANGIQQEKRSYRYRYRYGSRYGSRYGYGYGYGYGKSAPENASAETEKKDDQAE